MTGSARDGDGGRADGTPAGNGQAAVDPDGEYSFEALGAWPRWRRSRPFWGGLLVLLAAAEMLLSERAPIPVVIHVGTQGLAGYLVPTVLLLCGLLIWFSPAQRTFYSVLAVLLSLGSWVTSNLGGFFVGLALGVVGGSLSFAWTRFNDSGQAPQRQPARRRNEPAPRQDQPAGLDLLLSDPEEDALAGDDAAGPPRSDERAPDDVRKPVRDEPPLPEEPPVRTDVPAPDDRPIRIDVPSPDEPQLRQDASAADNKTGDGPLGSAFR